VPIDDTKTMRFTLYALPAMDAARAQEIIKEYDLDYDPIASYDELFYQGVISGVHEQGRISAQDYVAVRGQGVICDRSEENLSASDAGVIFLRRVFLRELDAIRAARPTKSWARIQDATHLPPPPSSVQAAE
jgi:5,5'-dehydrodivanillate O-demethylase